MAAKFGSLRQSFMERSKERLLSRKGYNEFGFSTSDAETDLNDSGCFRSICNRAKIGFYRCICDGFSGFVNGFKDFWVNLYEMGRSDPRKVFFSAKMGLCLVLVSLLIFLTGPLKDVSQYAIWAILTVVVCFEYSVGASLSKGCNRAIGTLSAGAIALGIAEVAIHVGEFKEAFIIATLFVGGFCVTYVKLYPKLKPYEYGFRVFLLTFCLVLVTGNKTSNFLRTAYFRLLLIAIGAGMASLVNICIYPIWAGEDLHKLVVKNFKGVATSLEGCVDGYLRCVAYDKIPSKILTYQVYDDPMYGGYRAALQSTSQEESLLGFATWEPPHGPYKSFNYPWENYVKVSGALRHCAFMVMAMHGCILSEIQAPAEKRQVFVNELRRVGTAGAKLLRDLGSKVEKMEKLNDDDILAEVHAAAEQLQTKIDEKSYLLVSFESWEEGKRPKEFEDPDHVAQMKDCGGSQLVINSLSVLSMEPEHMQSNIDITNSKISMFGGGSSMQGMCSTDSMAGRTHWPSRISILPDFTINEKEAQTYESASSLSLATFASLLVEFVARLGYLVDAFEELSESAHFKEPTELPANNESTGLWKKLVMCFQLKN
ncbi:aluminum-activated malate transporter 4-like [Chenopodium quinoa]|uniref:aluminum-activated malate transporter 4-like n=1 Tax=Chenopodium quinoa TaxID=63459 RepID=UPI000B78DE40|nr:aluminum-activated malate transporter 4-like [Chenopodium quinoa]